MFIAGIEMTEGTLLPADERDTPREQCRRRASVSIGVVGHDHYGAGQRHRGT